MPPLPIQDVEVDKLDNMFKKLRAEQKVKNCSENIKELERQLAEILRTLDDAKKALEEITIKE